MGRAGVHIVMERYVDLFTLVSFHCIVNTKKKKKKSSNSHTKMVS